MKKKFLSVILVLCLIVTGFAFAGCTVEDITLTGGPAYEDEISGNGGLVVTKGDYVYFANGYTKSADMGGTFTNVKGDVTETGLYRAKMAVETVEEVETKVLTEVQLMVSKTVGFENGGLYIFKDKIYFASPTTESDSTGVRYDLLTFFSCNLDGSNLKTLYQTTEFSNGKFSMTMIDEKVYLLVYTGSSIIRIEENGIAITVASEVTGVILPTRETVVNNEENPDATECFVYYTIDKESEGSIDLGNILYKSDIKTNTQTELYNEDYIEITLNSLTAGRLFYKRNEIFGATSVYAHYSNSLDSTNFIVSEIKNTTNASATILALGNYSSENLGVAILQGNQVIVREVAQTSGGNTLISSSVSKLLFSRQGYLYYISSSAFYRITLTGETPSIEKLSGTLTISEACYDADDDYFYFCASDTEKTCGYSMYRVELAGSGTNKTPVKMA